MRLSRLLISLPLIAAPAIALMPHPGSAAMQPIEALEQLAKSRTAEARCRTLDQRERDELAGYLARAEVAVTRTAPLSDVQGSLTAGRMAGEAVPCSDAVRNEITATLAAARRAMAAVEARPATRIFEPKAAGTARNLGNTSAQGSTMPRDNLARYGRQAKAYYVERRCTHLSGHKTRNFYDLIVRRHQAAVQAYGGPAVGIVLRRAEAEAADIRCAGSRSLVAAAYSDIRR